MVTIYLLFAGIALIVFACTPRLRGRSRIVVAFLTFLVPSVGMTAWVLAVGDTCGDCVNVDLAK